MSKRQLRKDYQLAMQRMNELHAALELVNYHLEANESGPEQHRYMLYNEKQTLLSELDRFAIYIRTEEERVRFNILIYFPYRTIMSSSKNDDVTIVFIHLSFIS